jgi:hypothetical protein
MNYREPLTKNEIREHAAHYENSNPAVYCGTYAKYNNGSLYGMWIDLSTFENYHDFRRLFFACFRAKNALFLDGITFFRRNGDQICVCDRFLITLRSF